MKLKKLAALLLCAAVMLPLAACVKKAGRFRKFERHEQLGKHYGDSDKRQRYLNSRYR